MCTLFTWTLFVQKRASGVAADGLRQTAECRLLQFESLPPPLKASVLVHQGSLHKVPHALQEAKINRIIIPTRRGGRNGVWQQQQQQHVEGSRRTLILPAGVGTEVVMVNIHKCNPSRTLVSIVFP